MGVDLPIFAVVGYALTLLLIFYVLLERREPGSQFSWILLIVFLPYLGALLYLLFGGTRLVRTTRRKLSPVGEISPPSNAYSHPGLLSEISDPVKTIAKVAARLTEAPVLGGNHLTLLRSSDEVYESMLEDLQKARQTIHLQVYILAPGPIAQRFLHLLTEKARQGVEVRLLLDSIGSLWLDRADLAAAERAGVRLAWFKMFHLTRALWFPNFRNHRKILSIDRETAYVGGVNIGDRFLGWRDLHLRVAGPAVAVLEETFREDWFFMTDEALPTIAPKAGVDGGARLQIVNSGPDHAITPLERIALAAIHSAHERILIATAYFVPGVALRSALISAADRGVEIIILLPRRADTHLLDWASFSYFEEFLQAGVRVFRYEENMYHAKGIVVDREFCAVGSANFDNRSFKLNFETTALMYGRAVSSQLEQAILEDLEQSTEIHLDQVQSGKLMTRLLANTARLISPLL